MKKQAKIVDSFQVDTKLRTIREKQKQEKARKKREGKWYKEGGWVTPELQEVLEVKDGRAMNMELQWRIQGGILSDGEGERKGDRSVSWTSQKQGIFIDLMGMGMGMGISRLSICSTQTFSSGIVVFGTLENGTKQHSKLESSSDATIV